MRVGEQRGTELAAAPGYRIETLDRGPDAELGEALVAFWTGAGALDEPRARQRLAQVVCVLRGPDGAIAGVNSAYEDTAPLIERRLWMYRRYLAPGVPAAAEAPLLGAAYEELARRRDAIGTGPAGLCVVLGDRAAMDRDRRAVWDHHFVYAGYTDAGEQVRVAYFVGARI